MADADPPISDSEDEAAGSPAGPPIAGPGEFVEQAGPVVAREEERLSVHPDGDVVLERERIEEMPVRRVNRFAGFWPIVALLLALALIGVGIAWWYFSRDDQQNVPVVTAMPLDEAVVRLEEEGFKTEIVNQPNAAPRGIVYAQRPSGGTGLDKGSTVIVFVSKGPATVAVPNGVGLSEPEARDRLTSAGLQVRVFEVFSDEPNGTVVAQDPGSAERVQKGETVRLNVSKGTGLVDVPSVVGQTRAEAEAQLSEIGLKANVFEVPSVEPAGTVVAQNPVGGRIREGSSVRLNVSTGSP